MGTSLFDSEFRDGAGVDRQCRSGDVLRLVGGEE
jgi:hypothetical protein